MRATLAVPALAIAGLVLAGCASTASDAGPENVARSTLELALQPIAYDRNNDINFAARAAADALSVSPVVLIGIREDAPEALGDTFGSLEFLLPEAKTVDNFGVSRTAGPFCFTVEFNYYGAAERNGVVETDRFDCPADAAAIAPPPDETVYPIVAANAREAIHEVLERIAAGGPVLDDVVVAAQIIALLTPPTSEFESLAEPEVVTSDGNLGVAIASSGDCVLVKLVDNTVSDVYPPAVLLQPGELGCTASTALADDAQLQSPH